VVVVVVLVNLLVIWGAYEAGKANGGRHLALVAEAQWWDGYRTGRKVGPY